MTVQGIIKRAMKRLELEGKILTPDFYAEAFCKEAQKAGVKVEDCFQVNKMTDTLNKDLQKDLQKKIRADDLVRVETMLPRSYLERLDEEAKKGGLKRSQLARLVIVNFIDAIR